MLLQVITDTYSLFLLFPAHTQGEVGPAGSTGPTGVQGARGEPGVNGPVGPVGPAVSSCVLGKVYQNLINIYRTCIIIQSESLDLFFDWPCFFFWVIQRADWMICTSSAIHFFQCYFSIKVLIMCHPSRVTPVLMALLELREPL